MCSKPKILILQKPNSVQLLGAVSPDPLLQKFITGFRSLPQKILDPPGPECTIGENLYLGKITCYTLFPSCDPLIHEYQQLLLKEMEFYIIDRCKQLQKNQIVIRLLKGSTNPGLKLLNYHIQNWKGSQLVAISKTFFTPLDLLQSLKIYFMMVFKFFHTMNENE